MRLLFLTLALLAFASSAQAQYGTYCSEQCTTLNDRWKVCWKTDPESDEEPYMIDLKEEKEARLKKELNALEPKGESVSWNTGVSVVEVNAVPADSTAFSNVKTYADASLSNISSVETAITFEHGTISVGNVDNSSVTISSPRGYYAFVPYVKDEPKPCRGFMILADGRKVDLCPQASTLAKER